MDILIIGLQRDERTRVLFKHRQIFRHSIKGTIYQNNDKDKTLSLNKAAVLSRTILISRASTEIAVFTFTSYQGFDDIRDHCTYVIFTINSRLGRTRQASATPPQYKMFICNNIYLRSYANIEIGSSYLLPQSTEIIIQGTPQYVFLNLEAKSTFQLRRKRLLHRNATVVEQLPLWKLTCFK